MFDSHCHLTSERFASDRGEALRRMAEGGVHGCLTIGTGITDAESAADLAAAHPDVVWASAGLDPFSAHQAGEAFPAELARLDALLASGRFVALGECGIELHHAVDPLPVQCERFAAQIALAIAHDLPLVIHARSGARGGDAHALALDVMRAHPGARGVIHSFDGDAGQARAWLDVGFHVALNGMVTFRPNDALRRAAAIIPADHLLIETDAPYLAPVPHRGRRCEPAHAALTASFVADLRGERPDDLAAWAERNARLLLRLAS